LKISFSQYTTIVLLAIITMASTGCKEDTIIKAGITPSSDFIYTDNVIGDTLTINAKTVLDDSIATSYTDANISVVHGLGVLNDPLFGRTNWGIYMQVVPIAANLSLPSSVDSAVLILPYTGFAWGDSNSTTQTYSVYRIADNLSDTTTYYSKTYTNVESTAISASPVTVDLTKLKDSVFVQGAKKAPHLRIKLTGAFKDALVDAAKNSADNAAFLSAIKGLYIRATDTANSTNKRVPYFFLTGNADYMRGSIALYYQENGNTAPDSVRASFMNFITNGTVHYNYITRNYAGTQAQQYLQSVAKSDEVIVMQNEPGAALDIRIPNLKNLPVGLINKAQLVITQVKLPNDQSDIFTTPARVYPVGVDDAGLSYTILDRMPLSSSSPLEFMDGTAHAVTMPDGTVTTQYFINIPREVQSAIVNRKNELHLRINGTVTYPAAYRLLAGGSNSNKYYKIRLNIVYSKIN
jgi:hypothetical protein